MNAIKSHGFWIVIAAIVVFTINCVGGTLVAIEPERAESDDLLASAIDNSHYSIDVLAVRVSEKQLEFVGFIASGKLLSRRALRSRYCWAQEVIALRK